MEVSILELVAYVLGSVLVLTGVGAWLAKKGVDIVAGKVKDILEKTALGVRGVGVVAQQAGFEKIADVIEEAADVPDEAGDVAAVIEKMTKNQDFTKEAFLELFNEGKEVGVEGKDFYLKVFKKPE